MRFPGSDLKSKLTYIATTGRIKREIAAFLRQAKIDIVHVQCVSSQAHYALHAREALAIPLVVTLQGELTMDAGQLFQRSPRAARLLAEVMTQADVLTACSRKTLDDAVAFTGVRRAGPTSVIFNGARTDDFRKAIPIKRDRPYIFALGRLVPQKGFDVLLNAVADGLPAGWQLVLAGEGPEGEALKAQVAALGLNDRVVFHGRANRTEVPALMAGCEFVVVPSRADEGLPVVCAESMAAGKPLIGTIKGGIPEAIIDGETGLLVPAENVAKVASAMKRLSTDDSLSRTMAANASLRANIFEWPRVAGEYVAVYRQALTGSRTTLSAFAPT